MSQNKKKIGLLPEDNKNLLQIKHIRDNSITYRVYDFSFQIIFHPLQAYNCSHTAPMNNASNAGGDKTGGKYIQGAKTRASSDDT